MVDDVSLEKFGAFHKYLFACLALNHSELHHKPFSSEKPRIRNGKHLLVYAGSTTVARQSHAGNTQLHKAQTMLTHNYY